MLPEARSIAGRWAELRECFDADRAVVAAELRGLLLAYSGPGRHYHDQRHIAALLALSRAHRPGLIDPEAVDLAILYHDAVYEPSRSDNEARSAALAREALGRLGTEPTLIVKIAGYVEATQHGAVQSPVGADPDLDCLLDLDLSILAAAPAEYDAYATAIRREYSIYPDALYRRGRIAVLEKLLAAPRLFRTPALAVSWEGAARDNLAREIAALRAA